MKQDLRMCHSYGMNSSAHLTAGSILGALAQLQTIGPKNVSQADAEEA